MIWFVIGLVPILAAIIWFTVREPAGALIALGGTAIMLVLVFCLVYGMYDMGWIMQCGPRNFWEAYDCRPQ